MNNINLFGRSNFPLATETLDFMQQMQFLTSELARLGGQTYILTGCQQEGMQVSEGVVVIDGEIMPFVGGVLQEYVYLKESKRTVVASGYTFPDVYCSHVCEFGYADQRYKWEDFKPVCSNLQLADAIDKLNNTVDGLQGIPKGIITMWSGDPADIPMGWALCDGIDGRPNLMGRFVVGYNQSDDDYNQIGNKGGAKETTLSIENLPKHYHKYTDDVYAKGSFPEVEEGFPKSDSYEARGISGEKKGSGQVFLTSSVGNNMPHENRPPYYVLAYIIKL